ncbi:MAG: XRE family transcriptional regulator [Prevotella sp.]|nr:XRE family transcriptional regulator [Prevotella sp.]
MHIGNRIKEVLFEQGHNACWLADRIPCERSNVYHIFKRNDLGIQLLLTISGILNHDFFAELSAEYNAMEKNKKE